MDDEEGMMSGKICNHSNARLCPRCDDLLTRAKVVAVLRRLQFEEAKRSRELQQYQHYKAAHLVGTKADAHRDAADIFEAGKEDE
jgi:hypothetical protein